MGDLKDTIDLITSITDNQPISKERILAAKPNSLARMASEGTLQFPVLVSGSLDIETSQSITKALERNYSTFVQTALSLFPVMRTDTPGGVNAATFIKQFHQNQNSDFNRFDLVASLMTEGYDTIFSDDNYTLEAATYTASTGTITAKNKEQLIDLLESVRTDILNNKYIPKSEITYNFKDKSVNAMYNNIVTEASDPVERAKLKYTKRNDMRLYNYRKDKDKKDYEYRKDKDEKDLEYRKEKDTKDYDYRKDKDEKDFDYRKTNDEKTYNYRRRVDREKFKRDDRDFEYRVDKDAYDRKMKYADAELFRNVLSDNDAKKANELIATTLHIRVKLLTPEGDPAGIVDFIIGVKCIMHIIRSSEMISNMVGACTNNDKIFNFIRWTTGEISFFKDFLFNVNEIKADVAGRKHGSSGWWLSLKKRRLLAKSKRNILSKNQLLPNATIVINAEEAAYIKEQYGYDLYDRLYVNKIIDQYYLLGFVIVDTSAQVAHFLFENDRKNYQTVTFSALEKAGSNDERKFKEMLKTLNRI